MSWLSPRLFAVADDGQSNPFLVGPDREPDIRAQRPFFLLPILGPARAHLTNGAVLRMREWVRAQGKPITDVFVISHGWHRNFFSAMAAYDRLVTRLLRLIARGAIEPPQPFRPLFVAVHWHSDPGENLWLDKDGRRSKASFARNVRETFAARKDVGEADFERDFELIFDLLSSLSAPDTEASGPEFDADSRMLAARLDERYELRGNADANLAAKVSALWTCYYDADPRRVLLSQDQPARPFVSGLQAPRKLFALVLSAIPVTVLLGLLLNLPVPRMVVRDSNVVVKPGARSEIVLTARRATVRDAAALGWRWVGRSTLALARLPLVAPNGRPHRIRVHLAALLSIGVAMAAILWLCRTWRFAFALHRPATAIPWLALVPWLYLQVLFAAPALLFNLVSFLAAGLWIGPIAQWLRLVSDERQGLRDRPTAWAPTLNVGAALASVARIPIRWLRAAVALDSRVTNLADAIECQLAYYDMQRRGVGTGADLGDALTALFADCDELSSARLHLAGHSFGSVVVANAARRLAFEPGFKADLRTVTLLQGAIASGWLNREKTLRARVSGAISAIYSRYDTANGFWYPLSAFGRLAAGHVGLCGDFVAEHHAMPPILVFPPPLGTPGASCRILNIDASRFIYDGPAIVGGGHGDIFKDDVLHALWAATRA